MLITFATADLLQTCNEDKRAKRVLGAAGARKLRLRLDDLASAANLAVMRQLPGRCHELSGNRKGHLALDLDGGRRLICRPANEPVPAKDDGGLDWTKVTGVVITGIEDYHG